MVYLFLQNLYLGFLVVKLIVLLLDSLQQISDRFFLGINHLLKIAQFKTFNIRTSMYKTLHLTRHYDIFFVYLKIIVKK